MKELIFVLIITALTACSDSPGWILWSHTYATTGGRTSRDTWESYGSFFKVAECKSQIQIEIALLKKTLEERQARSRDRKIIIQEEKEVLKATTEQTTSAEITRFFCVSIGTDPRPKDLSTWILWEYVSNSESGKLVRIQGPYFEESFLTQIACERERTFRLLLDRELQAKSKAASKSQSTRTSEHRYLCRPLGVDVAEQIGVRPR